MKNITLIAICLMLMGGIAMAETTFDTNWDYLGSPGILDHSHEYIQRAKKNELGLGVDVTVFEFDGDLRATWGLESVEVQNKFDLNNKEYSGFIVLQVNLWRPIQKLIGR